MNPSDSLVLKSTLTNEKGEYEFVNLPNGNYILKTFLVGYNENYSQISLFENVPDKEIPTIILRTKGINLNEVSIVTLKKSIEFKNGNITVNIEDSPLAQGNSAFTLLSRLPGVTIDENNNILIQGRSGVKILIDDRVQQMSGAQLINILRSMNASSIEKIEVLKNPPIKYDAAGTGGLINIRTKKVKIIGFSGDASYDYSQGYYTNQYGGLALNYKGKKFVFFSHANLSDELIHYDHHFNKSITYNGLRTELDQRMDHNEGGRSISSQLGMDFYLNSKNTIGFKVNADGGEGRTLSIGNNYLSDNSLGYNTLKFTTSVPNPWHYLNFNINAEHAFDTLGTKLKFSADYSPNYDYYLGTYDNHFLDLGGNEILPQRYFRNTNTLDFNILTAKLDLEKQFKKGFSLEGGIKGTTQNMLSNYVFENKNNATGVFTSDTNYSNVFSYSEQIYAGYINFKKDIGNFNFQAGLRAENTTVNAESKTKNIKYTREYFNLFPLVTMTFNKNEDHNLQFSYNRRINRPNYNSFNPYKYIINLFGSSTGNPNIRAEYSNTFELSHTFKGKLSNSISYSLYDNFIYDLTLQVDSTRETIAYRDNLKNAQEVNYSLFFQDNITKWWEVSVNGQASYSTYSGQVNGIDYKNIGYYYTGSITNTFLILKKTKLEINGRYIGPLQSGVWRHNPKWGIYVAIKQSFYKDRLNVMMGLDDIFFTMIGSNSQALQTQNWTIIATNDSRRFKISLSYNFGKVKVQERDVNSNQEERNRVGR